MQAVQTASNSEADLRFVETVKKWGWAVITVAPRAESDDPPEWFAYTVGLPEKFGWPELICFGLGDAMTQVLNNAVIECRDNAITPKPGTELREVLQRYPVRLGEADEMARDYLGHARWFARLVGTKDPPPCLQLIWPDKNGVFPDDPACTEQTRHVQTPLFPHRV